MGREVTDCAISVSYRPPAQCAPLATTPTIGSLDEISKVKVYLIPALIKGQGHGADGRLDSCCGLHGQRVVVLGVNRLALDECQGAAHS